MLLPDREIDRYLAHGGERRTRHGTLSADDVRAAVARTRRRGWSLNQQALTEGMASLGVAVRDRSGTPVCALSVADLGRHYHDAELERTASAALAAADLTREITGH